MKSRKFGWMGVMLIPLFWSQPQAKETLPGSQVIMDWPQFLTLWEKAHKPPEPPPSDAPPVEFILSRAEYTGDFRPGATELTGTFEFTVLTADRWVTVPFLPVSLGLKEARLDGAPVAVGDSGGHHTIVLKKAGHHTLTTIFSVPTPAADGDPIFSFPVARTAMTLMTLRFPRKNLEIAADAAQASTTIDGSNGSRFSAILSPTERITVSWKTAEAARPALPVKLYSTAEHLLSISDAALRTTSRFSYAILNNGLKEIHVRVPANTDVVSVNGTAVERWTIQQKKDEKTVIVLFSRVVKQHAQLTVITEQANDDAAFTLDLPRTVNVEREERAVGVETKSGVEVTIDSTEKMRLIDVKELPADLWSLASGPLLFGFQGSDTTASLTLALKKHALLPTLTSTIDAANAVTLVTEDGQWITRVSYDIRNNLKQFLELSLPPDATVWSAFVDGEPAKPVAGSDGHVLIPLGKSGMDAAEAPFSVEVIYHVQGHRLAWFGRRSWSLPHVDLPVSQLLWSVYAPESIEALYFGGNMQVKPGFGHWTPIVGSNTTFSRTRADRNSEAESQAILEKSIRESMSDEGEDSSESLFGGASVSKQAAMELDVMAPAPAKSVEGRVMPIAFRIPEVGRRYRFGKVLLVDQAPKIETVFVGSHVLTAAKAVWFVSLGLLLYWSRRRWLPGVRALRLLIHNRWALLGSRRTEAKKSAHA